MVDSVNGTIPLLCNSFSKDKENISPLLDFEFIHVWSALNNRTLVGEM